MSAEEQQFAYVLSIKIPNYLFQNIQFKQCQVVSGNRKSKVPLSKVFKLDYRLQYKLIIIISSIVVISMTLDCKTFICKKTDYIQYKENKRFLIGVNQIQDIFINIILQQNNIHDLLQKQFLFTPKVQNFYVKRRASTLQLIQLNSFDPKITWITNDNSEIVSFELFLNKKKSIYKFAPNIGILLKEFLNGKVCFEGINNHYKISQYIQKRNFGSIVRMRSIHNEELVTCKIFKQGRAEFEQEFRNEVIALQFLKHKFIPKLKEYYIESSHYYIIYEFIEGASLDKYIKKHVLSKNQILKIMKDLLQVVQYLHKEGFSHQNIKLENIFYCSMLDQITLIDFGQQKTYDITSLRHIKSIKTLSTQDYFTEMNLFTSNGFSLEKDFLDCGLVFYQLITQQALNNQELNNFYESRRFHHLVDEINNYEISQFVSKLFNWCNLENYGEENFAHDIDQLITSSSD
ncbi:unnamed protein product [Paramecium octaurelia]|uniref:Protein kinase domain-containing protein n=1 Tax=Paramecium octaurelia TaxID=43137 RepID=A0A8S1VBV5_PAROT|nr:unnamed protein product [Paramecium octaurelia]